MQINPCHTVPTFRDSKVTLTDSHSILIYLCEQYGDKLGNQLWPIDPIDRINVLNKLFYSGTLLFRRDSDAIVSFYSIIFEILNEKKFDIQLLQGQIITKKLRKDQVAEHVNKIHEQYGILEKYLTAHKFMATDYVSVMIFEMENNQSTYSILFYFR